MCYYRVALDVELTRPSSKFKVELYFLKLDFPYYVSSLQFIKYKIPTPPSSAKGSLVSTQCRHLIIVPGISTSNKFCHATFDNVTQMRVRLHPTAV